MDSKASPQPHSYAEKWLKQRLSLKLKVDRTYMYTQGFNQVSFLPGTVGNPDVLLFEQLLFRMNILLVLTI